MASIEEIRPAKDRAWFKTEQHDGTLRFIAGGDWTLPETARLDSQLRALQFDKPRTAEIDARSLDRLDSAGAWLLLRTKHALEAGGTTIGTFAIPKTHERLFATIEREDDTAAKERRIPSGFELFLFRLGRGFVNVFSQGYDMLGYLGRVTIETIHTINLKKRFRWAAFVHQIELTGINALPIVGLLAFLIGIVMAYQGADQLRRFGAEIFTINLLGVGILRELGVLITSIIVAGRSGSAFTAQIGSMRVNEEIDAMQTIGLNVVDVLVLPRVLALVIALPLLTFYADVMAMIGGAIMCYFNLGIAVPSFLRQLQSAVSLNTLLVGLIKAPVFAMVIGLVGCFEGLNVERNAESVGRLTTRSVVEFVFLVITLDAGFSVLFSILGI